MRKFICSILVVTMLGGCLSSAQKAAAGQAAESCASSDITSALSSIVGSDAANAAAGAESVLMDVIAIIADGAAGWEGELVTLGVKYGAEAIVCAVQIAESIFNSGSGSALPTSTEAAFPGAHARALQFLQDHPAGK